MKDFIIGHTHQTFAYAVNVVIGLYLWNGTIWSRWKWYMAHRIVAITMTLSDLQGHLPAASLFAWFFVHLCGSWQDFNSLGEVGESRGPSAEMSERIDKQIDRQTRLSQYFAHLPGWSKHLKTHFFQCFFSQRDLLQFPCRTFWIYSTLDLSF